MSSGNNKNKVIVSGGEVVSRKVTHIKNIKRNLCTLSYAFQAYTAVGEIKCNKKKIPKGTEVLSTGDLSRIEGDEKKVVVLWWKHKDKALVAKKRVTDVRERLCRTGTQCRVLNVAYSGTFSPQVKGSAAASSQTAYGCCLVSQQSQKPSDIVWFSEGTENQSFQAPPPPPQQQQEPVLALASDRLPLGPSLSQSSSLLFQAHPQSMTPGIPLYRSCFSQQWLPFSQSSQLLPYDCYSHYGSSSNANVV